MFSFYSHHQEAEHRNNETYYIYEDQLL